MLQIPFLQGGADSGTIHSRRASHFILFASLALVLTFVQDHTACADDIADPIPVVQFKYEGHNELTGSPIFQGVKTDFFWGEIEKSEGRSRHLRHTFMPQDPDNQLTYKAKTFEWYSFGRNVILIYWKDVEADVDHIPQTLEEAQRLHEEWFQSKQNRVHVSRDFKVLPDSELAREEILKGFAMLGMTPFGPIWRIGERHADSAADTIVYRYTAPDGVKCRYEFDKAKSLFTRGTLSDDDGETLHEYIPAAVSGEEPAREDEFTIHSHWKYNIGKPTFQTIDETRRIYDFARRDPAPIALVYPPQNGDSIEKLEEPQIDYRWRDGAIVKAVAPLDMQGVTSSNFKRQGRWWIWGNILVITGILVVIFLVRRKRMRRIVPMLLLPLLMANTVNASDAYCGVHALYGAAKSLGVDVPLEDLISPRFISSSMGSTATNLVDAADAIGLHAIALKGLGIESLKAAQQPLILHASPLGIHAVYQHWILFLGFDDNGLARVVDGAGGVTLCTIEELLARWDGIAIAIHEPSTPDTHYLSIELSKLSYLVVYGFLLSLAISGGIFRRFTGGQWWRSGTTFSIVAMVALAASFAIASCGAGFQNAARGIDTAMGLRALKQIDREALAREMKEDVVIIDCRYEPDFNAGHIDGALSLPVDTGLGDFSKTVAPIDRNTKVVVYCQSASCGFSQYSATMLSAAGFTDIRVYKGGYADWKHNGNVKPE